MKEYNIGYEDGIKIAAQVLEKKYGQYLTHMIEFDNVDHFVKFASQLSFTKGTNHSNLWFPDNFHLFEFPFKDGCNILLGGQPTANQNYEILCLCDKMNVKRDSMLIAQENTQVYIDFFRSVEKWKEGKSSASKNTSSANKTSATSNSNCYIATACYGDYNAPQVLVFRKFMDDYLLKSKIGTKVVNLYYRYSPYLAKKLNNYLFINKLVKIIILNPIYKTLNFIQKHK